MNTTAAQNTDHDYLCIQRAEILVAEELELQGITDAKAEWGMSESDVAAMWLEDGTASCTCGS